MQAGVASSIGGINVTAAPERGLGNALVAVLAGDNENSVAVLRNSSSDL